MGFLDNVKDALRGAVSTRASKDAEAARKESPTATAPAETSPAAPAPEQTEEKLETYTVVVGDTLSEICARNGVPRDEVARINDIEDPDLIFPGQVFRIPNRH